MIAKRLPIVQDFARHNLLVKRYAVLTSILESYGFTVYYDGQRVVKGFLREE